MKEIALLLSWFDTLAATLLGVVFLVWFAALHLPHIINPGHPYQVNEWSSMFIALALCGASWIIATESLSRSHDHLARPEEFISSAARQQCQYGIGCMDRFGPRLLS